MYDDLRNPDARESLRRADEALTQLALLPQQLAQTRLATVRHSERQRNLDDVLDLFGGHVQDMVHSGRAALRAVAEMQRQEELETGADQS